MGDTSLGPNTMPWGLDVTFTLPNGDLRLLNVHLAAGCPRGVESDTNRCAIKFSQLVALENWAAEREAGEQEYGLLGDFNRNWYEGGSFIKDEMMKHVDLMELYVSADHFTGTCYKNSDPIDHIILRFRRPSTDVQSHFIDIHRFDYKNFKVSDHCPLVAEF